MRGLVTETYVGSYSVPMAGWGPPPAQSNNEGGFVVDIDWSQLPENSNTILYFDNGKYLGGIQASLSGVDGSPITTSVGSGPEDGFPYPPSEHLHWRFFESINSKLFRNLLLSYSNKTVTSDFLENLKEDIERLGVGTDFVDDASRYEYRKVDGFANPWSNKFDITLVNYYIIHGETESGRRIVLHTSGDFVKQFGNNYDGNDVSYGAPQFYLDIEVNGGVISIGLLYQVLFNK